MPGRNDRDQQKFENLQPRPSDGYRATGGAGGFWWVWFIILVCAFVWFAGWGWGSHGGWWWGTRRVTGPNAPAVNGRTYNGPTATPVAPATGAANTSSASGGAGANSAAALLASNKRQFEGKPLQASGVPVVKKVTNDVFWVGSNASAALLVVAKVPGNQVSAAKVKPGESVNVSGTVEKAPPAAEAEKDWGLDRTEAARLEQEGAYLNATQANPVQP